MELKENTDKIDLDACHKKVIFFPSKNDADSGNITQVRDRRTELFQFSR